MKYLHIHLFVLALLVSAQAVAGQAEYDDCILKHLKGVKLDVTTHLIEQACDENYKNPGFTSDKKKAYNHCLLEHLQGVESFQAVMDIKVACKNKYK